MGPAAGLVLAAVVLVPYVTAALGDEHPAFWLEPPGDNSRVVRNRVSFFQIVSSYWQALLSALEGNATDCAASILLRISSSRGRALS